eukprot:35877-Eustigmatos_ZCMA.PRE.1
MRGARTVEEVSIWNDWMCNRSTDGTYSRTWHTDLSTLGDTASLPSSLPTLRRVSLPRQAFAVAPLDRDNEDNDAR